MNKRLPLAAGTVLQSRYTVVGQLGHGGMGAVYEAKDNRTKATVALKETYANDDFMRHAFEREATLLANMSHEAFPRVTDYFAEDEGFYLVMELIRGKDLSEMLAERNAPFETEVVLDWADQILDALEDLHSQDIVHRDIKPSNLKLTPRGRIKLLDFGIAKGAAGDMTALKSTVGSIAAATLQYAPLEQVLRADVNWLQMLCVQYSNQTLNILDQGTDARSDLYALGATLYHFLTNSLPVNAPTRALSIWSGLSDKLSPIHGVNAAVPISVSSVIQKSTEIDRNFRLRSASEMRMKLNGARNQLDTETVISGTRSTHQPNFGYEVRRTTPPISELHNWNQFGPPQDLSDRQASRRGYEPKSVKYFPGTIGKIIGGSILLILVSIALFSQFGTSSNSNQSAFSANRAKANAMNAANAATANAANQVANAMKAVNAAMANAANAAKSSVQPRTQSRPTVTITSPQSRTDFNRGPFASNDRRPANWKSANK